jgi:hypothetical protein
MPIVRARWLVYDDTPICREAQARGPVGVDAVEKVSVNWLWNWILKLSNPGEWDFESKLRPHA